MIWLQKIKRAYIKNGLQHYKIPATLWRAIETEMPLLARYNRQQKTALRMLASRILKKKRITAVRNFPLTEHMRAIIATQVAIMIFGLVDAENDLSFDWIDNWHEIIVYPNAYRTHRNPVIPIQGGLLGVEIHTDLIEEGETFYQGPVIINWDDDAPHPLRTKANQVLLHELAHKMDMLNGDINGFPPLHLNMNAKDWYEAFETAYRHLDQQLAKGHKPVINPYAATNPAEFFAVCTEYFFEAPEHLHKVFPAVYRQMSLFFNQDFLKI
ncbi:M90 family metallopeptidase [Hydrogenovibrio kuenenii]|uniref:M90 family metallopeptidase n=1 Tax=Hydrogenovibrio kuenenii TaxID=63658 RepID=UPI0004646297|nr:M90 family metallopeptidase [Hydrogenovibrio kuenenii]